MVPRGPCHYQVYENTCCQVQKYPHWGHLALYRGPKAQFWGKLGQMSQCCHINRFEWPCNMFKWGFLTMLSTMVTFLFWLEVSVINKSKMAARWCHKGGHFPNCFSLKSILQFIRQQLVNTLPACSLRFGNKHAILMTNVATPNNMI